MLHSYQQGSLSSDLLGARLNEHLLAVSNSLYSLIKAFSVLSSKDSGTWSASQVVNAETILSQRERTAHSDVITSTPLCAQLKVPWQFIRIRKTSKLFSYFGGDDWENEEPLLHRNKNRMHIYVVGKCNDLEKEN